MGLNGTNLQPLSSDQLRLLNEQIKADIDAYCVEAYDDGHRNHLGASIIGEDCERRLYLTYRHCKHEAFDGRMLRLFNRGHREEARFIEWLRGIGFQVVEHQPDGSQFRISGVQGHYGGSLDGQSNIPDKYTALVPALKQFPGLLLEFKTYATKVFGELVAKGVREFRPKHYKQMCQYGAHYGYHYALYMAINKNDDDIHPELVELDWGIARECERKAEKIITARTPPPKIADTPADYRCRLCHFKDICHNGAPVEKNCRSCFYAHPTEGGQWKCEKFNGIIPKEFIPKGCSNHHPIA